MDFIVNLYLILLIDVQTFDVTVLKLVPRKKQALNLPKFLVEAPLPISVKGRIPVHINCIRRKFLGRKYY
jgi:hypothetical protein